MTDPLTDVVDIGIAIEVQEVRVATTAGSRRPVVAAVTTTFERRIVVVAGKNAAERTTGKSSAGSEGIY